MDVAGVAHSHVGLNLHYQLEDFGQLEVGVLAKLQVISLLDRRIDYNDYDRGNVLTGAPTLKIPYSPISTWGYANGLVEWASTGSQRSLH